MIASGLQSPDLNVFKNAVELTVRLGEDLSEGDVAPYHIEVLKKLSIESIDYYLRDPELNV